MGSLVKKEDSQVPEHLRRQAGTPQAGLENVTQQDTTWPRLSLCQSGSPQRKKSEPKYIEGLQDGEFFNSITREVFKNSVRIIPLMFFKNRILFKPMEEGGGLLCQAQDNKLGVGIPGGNCDVCSMALFSNGEAPECTQYLNYAVLVLGENDHIGPDRIAVLSFKSTSLKFAREWNALMRLRGVDAFANVFEVVSSEQKKDNQTWFVPIVKAIPGNDGWVSKEKFPIAQAAYQAMKELYLTGRLKVDAEDIPTSREPGSEEGPGEL